MRHLDRFVPRAETSWPRANTRWTRLYLDPGNRTLTEEPPATQSEASYPALGDGVTLMSRALDDETQITGPVAAKLFVSSTTTDADIFATLRAFAPDGSEVDFQGALDPHTPIGQGWLRTSHRKLDPTLTTDYRPYHTHDSIQPLQPGEVYELDVEIWPTSIVIPTGYRLGLSIRGNDYEYEGDLGEASLTTFKNRLTGCGPFLHDDPLDRPADVFGGEVTVQTGAGHLSRLLVPVIPANETA